MEAADKLKQITDLADAIAAQTDSDVLFINSPLERDLDTQLITGLKKRLKRKNAIMVLVTEGGNPDVAYRIARALQDNYTHFTVIVSGYCKSAGTLIALGANALVMSDYAELGPLDIQMKKDDHLGENQSGLTIPNALHSLQEYSYMAFQEFFIETVKRSRGRITTKTASKIATDLVTGLFAPVFQQLDPLHIGEAGRANSIAEHYGIRLIAKSKITNKKGLQYLIAQYPSHGFVIDRKEAERIFETVKEPDEAQALLLEAMGDPAITPLQEQEESGGTNQILTFLNTEQTINLDEKEVITEDESERDGHERPKQDKVEALRGKVSGGASKAPKVGA